MAPPTDAPSPTPSVNKRPRGSVGGTGGSRNKRRKPEDSAGPDSGAERERRTMAFGVGMVKGREEEWSEPADVKTKIDFLDLPVESLYRYLEIHDLLPRWDVTPWSEKPCIPPNALYSIPPPPQVVPIVPSPKDTPIDVDPTPNMEPAKPNGDAGEPVEGDEASAEAAAEEERIAPPTTRSKTAPSRRQDTPEPLQIKRGVMTLSDVYSARAVLAEKANQHWAKGLGGGQNREGETIVNFLYKNKVGHNRLLRVYNPIPAPFV